MQTTKPSNLSKQHKNYEILNLIGYGLAKFDLKFVNLLGFRTKTELYESIVQRGIAETTGVVKNRQDLFDPFFDNKRKGWWQGGDKYIHRKVLIDSLFGSLDVGAYTDVVRLYMQNKFPVIGEKKKEISPFVRSKFRQLQITGQEAELFFMHNYKDIDTFKEGNLTDARLFGDGYDFQIEIRQHFFLVETKGLRTPYGSIRMTQNEYKKAKNTKMTMRWLLCLIWQVSPL